MMKLRNVMIHYLAGPREEWIQSNTPPFAASRGIDVMDVNVGWVRRLGYYGKGFDSPQSVLAPIFKRSVALWLSWSKCLPSKK